MILNTNHERLGRYRQEAIEQKTYPERHLCKIDFPKQKNSIMAYRFTKSAYGSFATSASAAALYRS